VSDPLVCAVCLTKDRPAMLQRAIWCFRSQTYDNKRLLIYDNGTRCAESKAARDVVHIKIATGSYTIGMLRNAANGRAQKYFQSAILMHWDDDDWSAPTRMAEQVAALQSGEYDAMGYSDMLFWYEGWVFNDKKESHEAHERGGQAWLYTAPHQKEDTVLGTSLAYWRETWERKSFKDTSRGEDWHFYSGLRVKQLSGIIGPDGNPAMVASIHGGNECSVVIPGHEQWKRLPRWDERLREIMTL